MRDEKERETERPHTEEREREREREKQRERERNRERERETERERDRERQRVICQGPAFLANHLRIGLRMERGSPIRANRIRKCVHAINIGFFFANLFARIDSRE